MKGVFIFTIFIFICCADQQNATTFSPLRVQSLCASDTIFDSFCGNWNCIIRDSMSFGITIKKQNRILLLDYSNILYDGNILNAQSDTLDYASTIQLSNLKGSIIMCWVKNYYDEQQYKLKLELNKDKSVLFWEVYDFNKKPVYLPTKLRLQKE